MAEPQTMSRELALAEIEDIAYRLEAEAGVQKSYGRRYEAEKLERHAEHLLAIAAAVAGACWRDHCYEAVSFFDGSPMGDGATCIHCGQRRADGTEGRR